MPSQVSRCGHHIIADSAFRLRLRFRKRLPGRARRHLLMHRPLTRVRCHQEGRVSAGEATNRPPETCHSLTGAHGAATAKPPLPRAHCSPALLFLFGQIVELLGERQ